MLKDIVEINGMSTVINLQYVHPDKYNLKLIYMDYKKKLANLKLAQSWWDKQPESYKRSTTRPVVLNNVL